MQCRRCLTSRMHVYQSKHSRETPKFVRMLAVNLPAIRTRQLKCPQCGWTTQTVEMPVEDLRIALTDTMRLTTHQLKDQTDAER